MPNKLEVDATFGIFKVLLILGVLGIPIWIASFGLWYLFLAIPAGIVIYGIGFGLVLDYIQKEHKRAEAKMRTPSPPVVGGSITWTASAQDRAARINSEKNEHDNTA